MEETVVQFHPFVIAARTQVGYPLSRIINLDETPMRFKLPNKTCGISNALDGTEDDELYTEDGQDIEDDGDNEFETESDADGE